MARARSIKPAFYKNEQLAECSIWARYIYPGLWQLADREGRLEDRPKRIKAELLPFDSADVEKLLAELETRGFILRYQVEEQKFMQILTFSKHQKPHHREVASVIPPPLNEPVNNSNKDAPRNVLSSNGQHSKTEKGRVRTSLGTSKKAVARGGNPPLNPIPLTLSNLNPLKDPRDARASVSDFEALWNAYPKRAGNNPKKRALRCYRARLSEKHTSIEMLEGAQRYAKFCALTGKTGTELVLQCATFLGPDKPFLQSWKAGNGSGEWWKSEVGTLAKGRELRVAARPGESMEDYRQRIRAALT
jgi:hypothetical protein